MQSSGRAAMALARLLTGREPLASISLARQLSSVCKGLAQQIEAASCSGGTLTRAAVRQGRLADGSSPWLRMMSTASEEAAIKAAVEDTLRPKVLRFFALFMICSAGLNVAPNVAAASVGNCLALLEAEQPFMVKAGCSRLQLLMRLEAARQRAVELDVAGRLLRLLQRPGVDAGVADYALTTLEAVAGCETGLAALGEAGGTAVLQGYLAATERSLETEDGVYKAQQLLAALEGGPPAAAAVGTEAR